MDTPHNEMTKSKLIKAIFTILLSTLNFNLLQGKKFIKNPLWLYAKRTFGADVGDRTRDLILTKDVLCLPIRRSEARFHGLFPIDQPQFL